MASSRTSACARSGSAQAARSRRSTSGRWSMSSALWSALAFVESEHWTVMLLSR